MIFKKKDKESKPKKEKSACDESRHTQENCDCLMVGADYKRQLWGVLRISPPLICTRYMKRKSLNKELLTLTG